MLEEQRFRRDMRREERPVLDVAVQLVRVDGPAPRPVAVDAAEPGERADARPPLVADDIVGIVLVEGRSPAVDEGRQAKPRAEIDQDALEPAHVAVRLDHRPADRVADRIRLRDRPVEKRNAVVPLEIGRVGQDQVGIGDHLGRIGVRIDDLGDAVFAGRLVLVLQHADHAGGVHRRVPRHVGHVEEQHVGRIGIARMGVGDHHMHQAVGGDRRVPGECLVDARRIAVLVDQQVFRAEREAEMRARERLVGAEMLRLAVRARMRLERLGIRRLVAEAAGAIDRADQHLQHVQRARRLEAVGMGRDAAHGMEGDRTADECLVALAMHVGPGLVDLDRFVERHAADLGCKAADRGDIDADTVGDRFRRVLRVEIFLREKLEGRDNGTPVVEREPARKSGPRAARSCRDRALGHRLVDQRAALRVAGEKPVAGGSRRIDHQPCRVRVADQIVDVDAARLEQLVDERENQQPVRTGPHADPVVGDRRIAGADRVDRHEAGTALLELGYADLDRVRIMVLGDAEQHEELGPVPVGRPELPERAADRHDAGRRHVDRAEAAMGGVVRRSVLLSPEARQGLGLVATGEEGELPGVAGAGFLQPVRGERERLVPRDRPEFAGPARPGTQHRRRQARGRVMLHDAGRTLGAQNALVHRMIAVALDVADLAVLKMDVDAAAARAHVAGRLTDFVRNRLGQIDLVGGHSHWLLIAHL